mmetsp:Transcript_4999/g.11422  ORF Transcript_4999/g.11422 Transcript_4999/m.11422 type:complete len:207 (-) Transcript_4999:529-1149(-)
MSRYHCRYSHPSSHPLLPYFRHDRHHHYHYYYPHSQYPYPTSYPLEPQTHWPILLPSPMDYPHSNPSYTSQSRRNDGGEECVRGIGGWSLRSTCCPDCRGRWCGVDVFFVWSCGCCWNWWWRLLLQMMWLLTRLEVELEKTHLALVSVEDRLNYQSWTGPRQIEIVVRYCCCCRHCPMLKPMLETNHRHPPPPRHVHLRSPRRQQC